MAKSINGGTIEKVLNLEAVKPISRILITVPIAELRLYIIAIIISRASFTSNITHTAADYMNITPGSCRNAGVMAGC